MSSHTFLNSGLIPTPHYPHRTKEQHRTTVATAERRPLQEMYLLENAFLDSDLIPTPHYLAGRRKSKLLLLPPCRAADCLLRPDYLGTSGAAGVKGEFCCLIVFIKTI